MKGFISSIVATSIFMLVLATNSYYPNCPRGGFHYDEHRNEISYVYDTTHMHVVDYDSHNEPIVVMCFIFSQYSREVIVCAKCGTELFRSSDSLPTGAKDHRMANK